MVRSYLSLGIIVGLVALAAILAVVVGIELREAVRHLFAVIHA